MSKYILLVEDDVIAILLANQVLKKLNCKVDNAKNGEEALKLANQNRYHLILLDLGLPI